MYLLAPFHSAKFLVPIQSYEDVPFLDPKWPTCHKQKFFGTNNYYYFHLTIGPFHCAKFLKNSYSESKSYEDASFLAPKWFICPKQNFFFGKKLLISFSSTYWPLSFCKIFKKFLEPIQSYKDVPFSGPKYPNLS